MIKKEKKQDAPMQWKSWLVVAVFIALGAGLMSYPFISNYIFEHRQDSKIQVYEKQADSGPSEEVEAELEKARQYNETIYTDHIQLQDPFKTDNQTISQGEYQALLNAHGDGLMGYVKIPCINVELPIYHGTEERVLENGVGHLEGTSLPVGGETTHSVLTGHTGLNRAKLFTDLTQMQLGDQFYLYISTEKLAYEVDQILIVIPEDTEALTIVPGQDYCTLITCTPYGVNSHRLFVRGHRIPYVEEAAEQTVTADDRGESLWMRQYKRALIIGFAIVIAIAVIAFLVDHIRWKMRTKHETEK